MKPHRMKILLLVWVGSAFGADAVDPALVGTWQLDAPGATVYWSVRDDGVYRLHGVSANPRQAGAISAQQGKWSITSPVWQDAGTYRMSAADAWVVTGRFGTGTWKRVWKPVKGGLATAGSGACALLADEEAARALSAPVVSAPDARGGCTYQSKLDSADQIFVSGIPARREAWKLTRSKPNPHFTSIPGVGEDAYAETAANGSLVAHLLSGTSQFMVTLALSPQSYPETLNLPALITLAHAAAPRLNSVPLLMSSGSTRSTPPDPISKVVPPGTKGGWIPGGNRPPQKGPKPFEGWPTPK